MIRDRSAVIAGEPWGRVARFSISRAWAFSAASIFRSRLRRRAVSCSRRAVSWRRRWRGGVRRAWRRGRGRRCGWRRTRRMTVQQVVFADADGAGVVGGRRRCGGGWRVVRAAVVDVPGWPASGRARWPAHAAFAVPAPARGTAAGRSGGRRGGWWAGVVAAGWRARRRWSGRCPRSARVMIAGWAGSGDQIHWSGAR